MERLHDGLPLGLAEGAYGLSYIFAAVGVAYTTALRAWCSDALALFRHRDHGGRFWAPIYSPNAAWEKARADYERLRAASKNHRRQKKTCRPDGEKPAYRIHADVSIGPIGIAGAKRAT